MTTKKELVEAHAFSRRRLATAFLSGAPGGREVEPSRPGRTIVAGVALAVLLVAGAAIASVLSPRTASGWDNQGVVISKQTGERYLIVGDTKQLRPVINVTSAQLVLGMDYTPTIVSQQTLDGRTPGPAIGILGAPPELPPRSAFIGSGWTACTADHAGVAVDVSASPQVAPMGGRGAVVRAAGRTYLVADGADGHAHAYPLADALGAQPLFAGTQPATAELPSSWLALLGAPVSLAAPPGVTAVQTNAGYDVVRSTSSGTEATSVGSFAAYLIAHGRPPQQQLPANTVENDHLLAGSAYAQWPQQLLQSAAAGPVCAQLQAAPGRASQAVLATPTGTDAWPIHEPAATASPVVRVDPGRGAFVRSAGSGTAPGTTFMIAATGERYLLADPATLTTLDLSSYAAPTVDPAWMSLFARGPELAQRAALCPPGQDEAGRC